MSRVVNTNSPGNIRNTARRTIAEILKRMVAKRSMDAEARDMAATIVLELERMADTIDTTCDAWEKRNYFLKADRFRLEWEWLRPTAARLRSIITEGDWARVPLELATLFPRFGDISVTKMTRSQDAWEGSLGRLMSQE